MTKYVNCEDCYYQNFCENFDAFMGCPDGKVVIEDGKFIVLGVDTNEVPTNNRSE